MKNYAKMFVLTFLGLFIFAGAASAHVTVAPQTSTTGAWETYTVKVPVEKEVPTTKITLKTPAGVEIESYQPVPGWKYSAEKDSNGKVKTLTFEATGEGIQPGQFQLFSFIAKNPTDAGEIAWDAYQYYQDGSIVEWTGNEGSDTPHSITNIVTETTDKQSSGATTDDTKKAAPQTGTASAEDTDKSSPLPLVLSIIAVILSLAAAILAARKKA